MIQWVSIAYNAIVFLSLSAYLSHVARVCSDYNSSILDSRVVVTSVICLVLAVAAAASMYVVFSGCLEMYQYVLIASSIKIAVFGALFFYIIAEDDDDSYENFAICAMLVVMAAGELATFYSVNG